jgi:hypothetical protein
LVTTKNWRVLGGSATGTSHADLGKGCQDAHAWYVDVSVCCFAVADGAGSRPRSAEGSTAAVAAATDLVKSTEGAKVPTVGEVFEEARRRLEEIAGGTTGAPVDDFATTLAVVIVGEHHVEVGQVGDSIVVVRHGNGFLHVASPAEKFEYANETAFLTGSNWRDHLRIDRFDLDDVSGVTLSTDGLRFKILDDLTAGKPYEPFFEDVFRWFDSKTATSDAVARFIDRLVLQP